MWIIVSLIIIGVFLLVAELILLPGLTVAGILALGCYGTAIYLSYANYGAGGVVASALVIVALSVIAAALCLRARTWRKLSLKSEIDGVSQDSPERELSVGDTGTTITRLAPMGNVMIGGKSYEAKSLGDLYIDPGKAVEVVGFENFNVIIKLIN